MIKWIIDQSGDVRTDWLLIHKIFHGYSNQYIQESSNAALNTLVLIYYARMTPYKAMNTETFFYMDMVSRHVHVQVTNLKHVCILIALQLKLK